MKEFKSLTIGPVGQELNIASIADFKNNILNNLKILVGNDLKKAVGYFILSMDQLILKIAEEKIPGADKKATVLSTLGTVYDNLIVTACPIWLKPIAILLKTFVLNTICSMIIDWIVDKYKNGAWKSLEADAQ
jgi:hypothetical protein